MEGGFTGASTPSLGGGVIAMTIVGVLTLVIRRHRGDNVRPWPVETGYAVAFSVIGAAALVTGATAPGVVTLMGHVVAPAGTVAVMCVVESTINTALLPLNDTTDAELKFVPVMPTEPPATQLIGEKLAMTGTPAFVNP